MIIARVIQNLWAIVDRPPSEENLGPRWPRGLDVLESVIVTVCGSSKLYLCVCVYPAFTAYILVTVGHILMKLGGSWWLSKDAIPNFFMIFFLQRDRILILFKEKQFCKKEITLHRLW